MQKEDSQSGRPQTALVGGLTLTCNDWGKTHPLGGSVMLKHGTLNDLKICEFMSRGLGTQSVFLVEGSRSNSFQLLTAFHPRNGIKCPEVLMDANAPPELRIIPRGGLKVRLIPAWDTHEPILLKDFCPCCRITSVTE